MATEWLTVREAVEESGYNYDYLRELLIQGQIIGIKKGNAWWVERKSLIAYVKTAKQKQRTDKRHGAKTRTGLT